MRRRAAGVTAGLLCTLLLTACDAGPAEVPAELRGRWITDDPRFAGRALELGAASVTFVTGEQPPTTHAVLLVERDDSDQSSYLLGYDAGESVRLNLALRLDPATGILTLIHRPEVRWRREDSS